MKMHLKLSSGIWRPFCLGLNVLNYVFHKPDTTLEQRLLLIISTPKLNESDIIKDNDDLTMIGVFIEVFPFTSKFDIACRYKTDVGTPINPRPP